MSRNSAEQPEPSQIAGNERTLLIAEPRPDEVDLPGRVAHTGLRAAYNRATNARARHELERAVNDLSSRLNYTAIFDYYLNTPVTEDPNTIAGNQLNLFSMLAELRRAFDDGSMRTAAARDIKWWLDQLVGGQRHGQGRAMAAEWDKLGFLLPEPQARQAAELTSRTRDDTDERVKTLVRRATQAFDDLLDYEELGDIYRREGSTATYTPRVKDREFRALELLRALDGRHSPYSHHLVAGKRKHFDPALVSAAEVAFDQKLRSYRESGQTSQTEAERAIMLAEQRARQTWGSLRDKLPVIVLNRPLDNDEIRFFDEPSLFDELQRMMPACFLADLANIEFTTKPAEAHDDDPTFETLAWYVPKNDLGNGTVEGAHIQIFSSLTMRFAEFAGQTHSERMTEYLYARMERLRTVAHEIGHHVHRYTLSLDELRNWEQIMRDDRAEVTHYVRVSRAKSDAIGRIEDFCESFSYFFTYPALLQEISPRRFAFMRELCLSRLDEPERQAYNDRLERTVAAHREAWAKQGRSPADVAKALRPWLSDGSA